MIEANQQRALLQALQDADFQRELHSLLWIDAFDNSGEWDGGWSCRDHTAVTGAFLSTAGLELTILHGRCYFVQGPTGDGQPPVAVGQHPDARAGHTWLGVAGFGHVDLSPNLGINHERWRPISSLGFIGDAWLTERTSEVLVTGDRSEYITEVELSARKVDALQAVYLMEEYEQYELAHAAEALTWANSPLTDHLRERGMPEDAYVRFAAHLAGLVTGQRPSLAGKPVPEAWACRTFS